MLKHTLYSWLIERGISKASDLNKGLTIQATVQGYHMYLNGELIPGTCGNTKSEAVASLREVINQIEEETGYTNKQE